MDWETDRRREKKWTRSLTSYETTIKGARLFVMIEVVFEQRKFYTCWFCLRMFFFSLVLKGFYKWQRRIVHVHSAIGLVDNLAVGTLFALYSNNRTIPLNLLVHLLVSFVNCKVILFRKNHVRYSNEVFDKKKNSRV